MPVPRRVLCSALLVLVALAGCGVEAAGRAELQHPSPALVAAGAEGDRPVERALAVLRRWDERRAAAYASGRPAALRRLYVRGSWAGARDVRLLREYAARGLVVRRLQVQLLDVDVLAGSGRTLRMTVVDRVTGGEALSRRDRSRTALPVGRPRSRVLTFERAEGRWLLRSVRPG